MDDTEIFDHDGALTAEFLADRGYCCGNGCRNCPYVPRHGGDSARLTDADRRSLRVKRSGAPDRAEPTAG